MYIYVKSKQSFAPSFSRECKGVNPLTHTLIHTRKYFTLTFTHTLFLSLSHTHARTHTHTHTHSCTHTNTHTHTHIPYMKGKSKAFRSYDSRLSNTVGPHTHEQTYTNLCNLSHTSHTIQ